ncbi:MAG TPA: response regulator [Candidatus Sulfotelmatobacter sp.]|nr:response regulator [Candidatus Sulfotelmatobacter sp.]
MTKRILIVDDNALVRQQIRRLLESHREIEICAEATDGAEAVLKVSECHPDLVVLDFLMPRMNGLEAARKIRKLAPKLPILLFTLDQNAEIEREGQRAGADVVLPKANGGSQLYAVVHRLLQ